MQRTLALAMAKTAPTATQSQLQGQATAIFNANYSNQQGHDVNVTPTYTSGSGSQLVLTATAKVNPAFMQILGFSTINVGATSTIKWGNLRLRVSLVLDNTGSMASSNKMVWFRLPTDVVRSQHSRIRSTAAAGKNLGIVESDQLGTVGTQAARSVAITPRCRR